MLSHGSNSPPSSSFLTTWLSQTRSPTYNNHLLKTAWYQNLPCITKSLGIYSFRMRLKPFQVICHVSLLLFLNGTVQELGHTMEERWDSLCYQLSYAYIYLTESIIKIICINRDSHFIKKCINMRHLTISHSINHFNQMLM